MMDVLISSKTRIKLLLKLFLNKHVEAHLRGLEQEFGESSNAIRVELNRLEQAELLTAATKGNKKFYRANERHPLFNDIHNLLLKHTGIDQVVEQVIDRLGDLEQVYLSGRLVRGLESKVIDLIFVGAVDVNYLVELITKTEKAINRKIRYLVYSPTEFQTNPFAEDDVKPLLIWQKV
ncbi:MAG: ArsR family transcriptional regulator [Rhodothermia bacterium]|nr:ArsR family transcriptional regulator [Rhodothermia bacterium]